jgi:hypothetical protein
MWISHNFLFQEDYCEFFLLSTIERRSLHFLTWKVIVSAEIYDLNDNSTVGRRSVADPDRMILGLPDPDPLV